MLARSWHRSVLSVLGALAVVALAACNRSSSASPTTPQSPSLHQVVQAWLEAPVEAQQGDTVTPVLKVQNTTGAPLVIWGGMRSPEVTATTEDGAVVWSYWHERPADLALRTFTFGPGETKDYELE